LVGQMVSGRKDLKFGKGWGRGVYDAGRIHNFDILKGMMRLKRMWKLVPQAGKKKKSNQRM